MLPGKISLFIIAKFPNFTQNDVGVLSGQALSWIFKKGIKQANRKPTRLTSQLVTLQDRKLVT